MNRDVALMQYFILDQFTPIKRYVLGHKLFIFSVSSSLPISPTVWTLTWLLVILSFLFFLYWVLAWGIANGGVTLVQVGVICM
jgi:hypothetical protein